MRALAALIAAGALAAPAQAAGLTEVGCFEAPSTDRGCPELPALLGGEAVAVSPDGRHVYVAGSVQERGVLLAFARDEASGRLTFVQCLAETARDGCTASAALYGAADVVVSRGGRTVYALGSLPGSVGVFARDAASGALTPVQCFADGRTMPGCEQTTFENPWKLALPPGETGLMAAGAHFTFFDIAWDGRLSSPRTERVSGARNPVGVAVGPSPARVFFIGGTTDRGRVVTLARDPSTGVLTPAGCAADASTMVLGCEDAVGIDAPSDLAVTPDGSTLYVAASSFTSANPFDPFSFRGTQHASAITVFTAARTRQRACLLFTGKERQGRGCTRAPRSRGAGFWGASALAVTPDGDHVVAGFEKSRAVVLLRRNRRTQRLTVVPGPAGCVRDPGVRPRRLPLGCQIGAGIHAPTDVAITPDSRHAYLIARGSLAAFALR